MKEQHMSEQSEETTTEDREPTHMESVSSAYRTAAGINGDEPVQEEVVQKQNHSEHAGGQDGLDEPVTPPEGSVPNTVNEGAETAAATTPAGEHQPDEGDSNDDDQE